MVRRSRVLPASGPTIRGPWEASKRRGGPTGELSVIAHPSSSRMLLSVRLMVDDSASPSQPEERQMDERQQRERVAAARVARVGTLDEQGRAHLVPIVFVLDGDHLYSATDAGPRPAKRLRNLARDPRVTVLVDGYSEDWSLL